MPETFLISSGVAPFRLSEVSGRLWADLGFPGRRWFFRPVDSGRRLGKEGTNLAAWDPGFPGQRSQRLPEK
jgi:hypothetical protein